MHNINFTAGLLFNSGQITLPLDRKNFIEQFIKTHDLVATEKFFNSLLNIQLVDLYKFLGTPKATASNTPAATVQFLRLHVKDILMRRAEAEPAFATELLTTDDVKELHKEIRRATQSSAFMSLKEQTSEVEGRSVKTVSFPEAPKSLSPAAPLTKRILHVCLEYNKVGFTGVNAIVSALPQKQREEGVDARIVTPFYDIMPARDAAYRSAEFKGFIEHEYEGKRVKSSVYKVWSQTEGKAAVPHYLIKPDPAYANLFSIEDNQLVYDNTPSSDVWGRMLYFTSAVAALGAGYKGFKQQKSFAGVHYHSWTLGMATWLLKDLNQKRVAAGYAPVHSVLQFHGNTPHNHGIIAAEKYRKIGIDLPPDVSEANTEALAWLGADGILHVSKVYASQALDLSNPDVSLQDISHHKQAHGRLVGVTNGIVHKDWSITNRDVYHSYAIEPTFNQDKVDVTDYVSGKERTKQMLHQEGLISDPQKPLFVFVGRFTDEKGIATLPAMVEQIAKSGGQCVVMGTLSGGYEPAAIQILEELAKGKYAHCLKLYKNRELQSQTLHQVKKGLLIRQAAEFSLIPSDVESCGLVFPEAITAGCIPITSNVGGLKDFTKPFGQKNAQGDLIGLETFNSFVYDNKQQRDANAQRAIVNAMQFYTTHTKEQRNSVIRRFMVESKNYDWPKPVKAINQFYDAVFKPLTPSETTGANALKEKYLYPMKNASRIGKLYEKIKIFRLPPVPIPCELLDFV